MAEPVYPFLTVTRVPEARRADVVLSRPEAVNALDERFWADFPRLIADLEADPSVRFVVFSGEGPHFCAGLDIKDFYQRHRELIHGATGDLRQALYHRIRFMQSGFSALYHGQKIYLAALHGYCIGAGLDLAAACDLCLASADAKLSLREARVGIVADLGSLQRLPARIGWANTALLAYTGRDIDAQTAQGMGLVAQVADDKPALLAQTHALVAEMAANPWHAVQGTKQALRTSERLGADDGLERVALQNAAYLDSPDFREVIQATLEKRAPKFQ